jgi:hypothetical protein
MMKSMTTQNQSDLEKVKLTKGEMDEKVRIMNENIDKTKSLWRGEKFTPSNAIDMDKADDSDRVVEEFKRFLAVSNPSPDQPRLRPKVELDLSNIFKKKPATTDLKENVEKSLWRGKKFTPSNNIDLDKADDSDQVVEEFKQFLAGANPNPDQPRLRPKVELDLKNIFIKKSATNDLKQRADGLSSNSLDFMNGVKEVGRRQRNRDMIFSFETMNTFFD